MSTASDTQDTDVAFAAGAEAMREACADFVTSWATAGWRGTNATICPTVLASLANRVSRLPLPPAPEPEA